MKKKMVDLSKSLFRPDFLLIAVITSILAACSSTPDPKSDSLAAVEHETPRSADVQYLKGAEPLFLEGWGEGADTGCLVLHNTGGGSTWDIVQHFVRGRP